MDKQRLAQVAEEGGTTATLKEEPSKAPTVEDLRTEILKKLPDMMNDSNSYNKTLLQYFLQKEFGTNSPFEEDTLSSSKVSSNDDASAQVKSMKITKCPHEDRKHYAKNMCSSCYRKFGRN